MAPQALAMGSVTTLTIVALIADIGRDHVAVATSLSYVFRTTGQVLGVSLSGALTQAILQRELESRITGKGAPEVRFGKVVVTDGRLSRPFVSHPPRFPACHLSSAWLHRSPIRKRYTQSLLLVLSWPSSHCFLD